MKLSLSELQEIIKREYYARDSERGLFATFAWLVEEVGELADSLLTNDRDAVVEELADVIAWTLSVANLIGVDVEEAVRKKYGTIIEKYGDSRSS